MVRTALLARFRERWLSGALPLVVEHRPGEAEHVCAAPSLWMGARELALELSARCEAAGPDGPALVLDLQPGVRWVQALVAGLRVGATVHLEPPAPGGAWAVTEQGLVRTTAPADDERPGPGHSAAALTEQALGLAGRLTPGAVALLDVSRPVPAPVLLAALHDEAELHLTADPGSVHALTRGVPPDLVHLHR